MLPHCPALYCLFAVLLIVTVTVSQYFGQINDDDGDGDAGAVCVRGKPGKNAHYAVE